MDASHSKLDKPLSETEYDRLADLLGRSYNPDAMNPEEMDGFFAALICGPQLVPPSVYLEKIWGGGEVPHSLSNDINDFMNLVFRHWNSVSRMLGSKDGVFLPLLHAEEGQEAPCGNRWAKGFMRGINLGGESWNEIFATDDRFANLLSVFALLHEFDPDPELRTWKTPPDVETRKHVLAGLATGTQRVYDYFRSQRLRDAKSRRSGSVRTQSGTKIGRNDSCYCGSGKKYKRCCGSVNIH